MSRHIPVRKHVEMKGWGKQIPSNPCHPCLKYDTKHFWNVSPSASPYSISSISPSFLRKQNSPDTDGLQASTLTTKYWFFQRLKVAALALAPHAKCQKHSSLPPATISSHSLSWVLFPSQLKHLHILLEDFELICHQQTKLQNIPNYCPTFIEDK